MAATRRKEKDPWDLVLAGRYREAHVAFGSKVRARGDIHRANRAICSLALDHAQDALEDLSALASARAWTSEDDLLGAAHWIVRQPREAIEVWSAGLRSQYADGAGGVTSRAMLLFAGVRSRNAALEREAMELLRELVASGGRGRGRITNWPGPVARFLVGEIDEARLLASTRPREILRERERCQAHFWIGVRRLRAGDTRGYRAALREATSEASPHFRSAFVETEYWLAREELRRRVSPAAPRRPRRRARPGR